jgi:hypothetical protein
LFSDRVGELIGRRRAEGASASGNLRLAVSAKRYNSGLWEDIKKEPYTSLFNEGVSASYLWNIVQIMEAVDNRLATEAQLLQGRQRLIAIHGNRFVSSACFCE